MNVTETFAAGKEGAVSQMECERWVSDFAGPEQLRQVLQLCAHSAGCAGSAAGGGHPL